MTTQSCRRPFGKTLFQLKFVGLVCAVAVAGCAESRYAASHVTGPEPVRAHRVSMPVGMPSKPPELEDDGLPVQLAPFRNTVRGDDDPTEPFSPNYGTVPLKPEEAVPNGDFAPDEDGQNYEARVRRKNLPPPPVKKLLSNAEAERIIAGARANHGWRIW
ncbi:MAG: hypothetical protein AAF732_13720 [Pseudomonadota bacterium]